MKKTILITASSFPLDQQSTKGIFILDFAKSMSDYYKVIVLTHRVGDALSEEQFGAVQVKRYTFLPFSWLDRYFSHGVLYAFSTYKLLFLLIAPLYFLCQFLSIRSLIKKHNIELIHAHWIIPQGLAAVLYKRFLNKKVKIISTIHGGDIFAFKGKFGTILKRFVIKNIDQLSVVSTHIKQEVVKYVPNKTVHILPMGIHTQQFSPSAINPLIKEQYHIRGHFLLFVGRLAEKKGVRYLLEAMPSIVAQFPNTKLLIAGDGPLRSELEAQAKNLQLAPHVQFLGNIPYRQLPSFYATADVFIGPSIVAQSGDSEGFGLVFAEAAASTCLVITTDFPAMQDIIIHGKTGFTVAQKSSRAIANQVISSLNNPTEAQQIKQQGRTHVCSQFDWKIIGKAYALVYES